MTRYLQQSVGALALAIAVAALAMFASQDAQGQNPSQYFTPCSKLTLADATPGAPTEVNGNFGIAIGADCVPQTGDEGSVRNYNSGGLITFTPAEWNVAGGDSIAAGTKVGEFQSLAVLGLLNNPCNTGLPVNFNLLAASNDPGDTIDPLPPGTANRLKNLAADADGNGVPDGADKWPSYLNEVATRNNWDMSKFRARFVGFGTVVGANTDVVLNFLVFEPGSPLNDNIPYIDPRLGYPAVTVLQDPTTAASNADAINDFCAPLSTSSKLFGSAGGETFRANPDTPGTYYFTTLAAAAPDYDNDGIENALDPCNLVADSGWDPRGSQPGPGETDGDGLPDSCDPFPNQKSLLTSGVGVARSDEDGDKWMNRNDNCALVANEDQKDEDTDGIGDACDPEPGTRSSAPGFVYECLVTPVQIGGSDAVVQANPADLYPCNLNAPQQTPGPGEPGAPTPTLAPGQTAAPTPTFIPGTTTRPTTGTTSGGTGVGSGPVSGVGSLSPTDNGVPGWAAALTAVGILGLLGGATLVGTRFGRRRS